MLAFPLFSQYADADGAYPVCGNGTFNLEPQGTGSDDFADPDNFSPSCQFFESENVWVRIEILSGGTLGFDIIPDDLQGPDRDDYDFAVYGPNVTPGNLGQSIRCSSTNPQAAGVQAETGMNNSEPEFSEGPGPDGNGYVHWLDNVIAGEVYYILIDNFDRDDGFSMNWTGTALLENRIDREEIGLDLGPDINLCDNETTEITASVIGEADFEWNTGQSGPTIEVDEPGEYIVTVTTESGCVATDAINVSLIPAPIIDQVSVNQNNICEPVSNLVFTSSGTSGTYQWFDPSGNTIGGTGNDITIATATAADSGIYTLRVTRDNGCIDEESIEVIIHPLPALNISGNENLCEGDPATFTASGAIEYQWIDPNGNLISTTNTLDFAILDPSDSGTYQLVGETEFDCEDTLVFDVFVSPELTVDIQPQSLAICTTDPLDALAVANQTGVNFTWTNPIGETVSNAESIFLEGLTVEDTGIYTITARNNSGCVATDELFVDIDQSYLFDHLVEQCPGTTFIVPQTGELVTMTDTIRVDLLTRNGCDSIYIWDVQFLSCADDNCVAFPTAFVPNGNDLNESFNAIFSQSCIPEDFSLRIFNRWGEKVFETNDYSIGWDGSFENELAQQGVYLWELEYSFPEDNGIVTIREGGVNLIR